MRRRDFIALVAAPANKAAEIEPVIAEQARDQNKALGGLPGALDRCPALTQSGHQA
jgi:hypothetical protein